MKNSNTEDGICYGTLRVPKKEHYSFPQKKGKGFVKSTLWFYVKRRICSQVSAFTELLMLMMKVSRTQQHSAYQV